MPPGATPPKVGGQGPSVATGSSGAATTIEYPSTHKGWGALRFSVNQSLPGALRQGTRSYASTYAALATTRKGR